MLAGEVGAKHSEGDSITYRHHTIYSGDLVRPPLDTPNKSEYDGFWCLIARQFQSFLAGKDDRAFRAWGQSFAALFLVVAFTRSIL